MGINICNDMVMNFWNIADGNCLHGDDYVVMVIIIKNNIKRSLAFNEIKFDT